MRPVGWGVSRSSRQGEPCAGQLLQHKLGKPFRVGGLLSRSLSLPHQGVFVCHASRCKPYALSFREKTRCFPWVGTAALCRRRALCLFQRQNAVKARWEGMGGRMTRTPFLASRRKGWSRSRAGGGPPLPPSHPPRRHTYPLKGEILRSVSMTDGRCCTVKSTSSSVV